MVLMCQEKVQGELLKKENWINQYFLDPQSPTNNIPSDFSMSYCRSIVVLLGVHEDITADLPDLHTFINLSLHCSREVLDYIHLHPHVLSIIVVVQ